MQNYDTQKLYNTILDTSFLIRYGYYDVNMKKIESNYVDNDDLEDYYGNPENFYLKLLSLQDLYNLLEKEDLRVFFNFKEVKYNVDTEPIYFNIPKSNYVRREYKMPNIYSYLHLCYFIEDHKEEFINIFENNVQSTSKYFNELGFNFKYTKKIEQRLLFGGNNILSLDLSNFYHTLYTHSIPWVIHGKQNSKLNRSGGFANDLDSLIQKCQYGETHGIPTGSITSKLIAELYMCYIDKKLLEKGYKYARYVDDIKYPFVTNLEKENFLMEFNSICREHNLILNDKKTEVHTFPYKNNMQKVEIFNYFDNLNNKSKIEHWKNKINDFIDFCLSEEVKGNKGAIKCIYSVIINTFKYSKLSKKLIKNIMITREKSTNYNLYEKLLDTSLKDSRLTNKFITFTEQLIELGVEKEKIKKIVRRYFNENRYIYRKNLEYYISNEWNQEIYQILLYCVLFDEERLVKKSLLDTILRNDLDDYSKCLSIILWIKKSYSIKELLNNLETQLEEVHSKYNDDKSVRMQEKYWLMRYFIYYLINKGIIEENDIRKHYSDNKIKKDNNNNVKSELNMKYVLQKDTKKKAYVNIINEFYELLLDKDVALIQVGNTDEMFEYL
ncbi:RNA-directed DNA polymerase [Mammaliicoccus sciuri]|uniref:RNA-directed DNA polymerase n=1 Tax=Mammaliicoccus sciuri TaxID=1296 RepID=UPI002DBEDCAF|nr:RNA-directed DNA polymerase [Mammaliicoccus sciuri]MEB7770280.1 RNA-directed DNA polymerase [Mammaliicoccus sciuri]MEB7820381.1 RNA-directed DNA polymerase [Mammaliicoccus sciuri]